MRMSSSRCGINVPWTAAARRGSRFRPGIGFPVAPKNEQQHFRPDVPVNMPSASARFLLRLILAGLLLLPALARAEPPFPPPTHTGEAATLGLGIQRAMTLLATSTPQHRNTV